MVNFRVLSIGLSWHMDFVRVSVLVRVQFVAWEVDMQQCRAGEADS
jgi:hypothetical protein